MTHDFEANLRELAAQKAAREAAWGRWRLAQSRRQGFDLGERALQWRPHPQSEAVGVCQIVQRVAAQALGRLKRVRAVFKHHRRHGEHKAFRRADLGVGVEKVVRRQGEAPAHLVKVFGHGVSRVISGGPVCAACRESWRAARVPFPPSQEVPL